MATGTVVPVSEYLSTMYHPDRDYVDGELIERNVGEWSHSRLQILLASFLLVRERQLGLRFVTEQRVQITPTRYRIPDICGILASAPRTPILQAPPFLCIEILSPEDRLTKVQERARDFANMGVPWIWIVSPGDQRVYRVHNEKLEEAHDSVIRTEHPDVTLNLAEFWPLIDA